MLIFFMKVLFFDVDQWLSWGYEELFFRKVGGVCGNIVNDYIKY